MEYAANFMDHFLFNWENLFAVSTKSNKHHSKTISQIEKKLFPLRFQIENAVKKFLYKKAGVFSIRIR
jgi:hypothetical protein